MSDVAVTFGAETGDLEAALASANAEVKALTGEMRTLANEMEKAGTSADASMGVRLKALGAELVEAKSHTTGLKDEMKALGGESAEVGLVHGLAEGLANSLAPLNELKAGIGEIIELMVTAFAVEKIYEFAESMAQLGTATQRAATVLGIPTDKVAALGLVAKATGITLDDLQASFAKLSRNLTDESANSKRALDALHLSFKDLADKSAQEQLEVLAGAFSKVENGATKDAIAMELFGRAGVQMLPLLNQGRDGIQQWADVATEFGVALREDVVSAMEDTHKALTILSAATQGLGVAAFMQLHDAIDGAAKIAADFSNMIRKSITDNEIWGQVLTELVGFIKDVELGIAASIRQIADFDARGETATRNVVMSFEGLGHAIAAVFEALAAGIGGFFSGLVAAATDATHIVGQEFANMGAMITAGAHLDASGISSAWDKMKGDAKDTGASIKADFAGAMSSFDFSKASDELSTTNERIRRNNEMLHGTVLADEERFNAEKRTIDGESNSAAETEEAKHQATMAALKKGGGKSTAGKDAEQAYSGDVQAAQDAEKDIADTLNNELKTHKITMSEWLKQTNEALDGEALAVINAADKAIASAALTSQQKGAIAQKEAHELDQIARQESDAQAKAAEESAKSWKSGADTIAGVMNSQVDGILKGTTSVQQAFKNMAASAIEDIIKFCVKWLAEHIATEASVVAAHASGVAATKAVDSTAISGDAARAAAGAYAAVAGVPLIGPILAPAAAAAAFGAVEAFGSYDVGSWQLPGDMLAQVHAGEMIVPAAQTPWAQSLMSNAANGAGGGGGHTFNTHMHVNGAGSDFVRDVEKHAATLARAVHRQFKQDRNMRGAPAFTR